MNRRRTGAEAEALAAVYLSERGMTVLEKNFRCRSGEIDLIGRHEGYLVFVEVKYRSSNAAGCPEAAVGPAKQTRICRVADYYRCVRRIALSTPVRYDVVAVEGREIRWIRNAFPHRYG